MQVDGIGPPIFPDQLFDPGVRCSPCRMPGLHPAVDGLLGRIADRGRISLVDVVVGLAGLGDGLQNGRGLSRRRCGQAEFEQAHPGGDLAHLACIANARHARRHHEVGLIIQAIEAMDRKHRHQDHQQHDAEKGKCQLGGDSEVSERRHGSWVQVARRGRHGTWRRAHVYCPFSIGSGKPQRI
jgi:hypothetical protein